MATIGTGSPLLYVEGSAKQTAASGTKRTIQITAKFKVNGSNSDSWFAYACNWRARVNTTYGSWEKIKGTETWNATQGLRTFTQTLTVDVGTAEAKDITVGIYTDSLINNSWDGNYTWTFRVGATNRPPTTPGAFTIRNGNASNSPIITTGTGSATINENINHLYITWGASSDPDGDKINYSLNESRNNGASWSRVDYGADLAHSYSLGGWNEGQSVKYYVDAQDSKGVWSTGKQYSGTLTKNIFTPDQINSTSSIGFNTVNSIISFTYSGGSNTQGGVTIRRELYCNEGITVHNYNNIVASPITLTIYHSRSEERRVGKEC